jgi:hypothetical protein
MHKIGPLELEHLGETVSEGGHVGPQLIFRHPRRRPGRYVYHLVACGCGQPLWQIRIVAPGINRYRVPEPDEPSGQLSDVNVLTSGIDATDSGHWACMFRDQGNVHGNIPNPPGTVPEQVPGSSPPKPKVLSEVRGGTRSSAGLGRHLAASVAG